MVIEAQQKRFSALPNRKTVLIRSDAGGVHARRVIAELLASEAGAIGAPTSLILQRNVQKDLKPLRQ